MVREPAPPPVVIYREAPPVVIYEQPRRWGYSYEYEYQAGISISIGSGGGHYPSHYNDRNHYERRRGGDPWGSHNAPVDTPHRPANNCAW
ncbi:MAG: hypothetical protein WC229_03060 [Candidatus Paceibacterota bacterium]